MLNDNNKLIYKHEITVDIITLINSNIINDIVNIIITKSSIHKLFDLVKIKVRMQLTRFFCSAVNWEPIIFCKQTSYPVSITLIPNLDRINASLLQIIILKL